MAIAVPYSGVPTETLQPTPAPEIHPAIPEAAFGAEVGRAISGLGQAAEGAGDKVFAQGIALQNLQNETDAKEADANYMIAAGKLHADYSALQGNARVQAYPKLVSDLQQARMDARNGLSTSMAQKMFDSSALQTMSRTIFNAAGASAAAQKEYVIKSSKDQSALDANTVSENPDSEPTFQDKLQRARANAVTVSMAQGNPPGSASEQLAIQQATSNLWYNRIQGKSQTDPYAANRMLQAHSGELTDDDRIKLTATVRTQSRAIDSQNIATSIVNAGAGDANTPPKTLSQMEAEADAEARAHDPTDPDLAKVTRAAVQAQWNQKNYAQRQENYGNQQTVTQAITAGMPDYQTFRADPKAAAAEDALKAAGVKVNIPAEINNYNTARDRQDNMRRFNTIMGQANNDVLGFLDYNPRADTQLSQGQINQVVAKQESLKKQVNQDPQVDRGMSWLRQGFNPQMSDLGMLKRTTDNAEDYDHLTGTVQAGLAAWAEDHQGKQASQKEFDEQIAPKILQNHATPGWFGTSVGAGKAPLFKQDTSSDEYQAFAKKAKADALNKNGYDPSDKEVYQAYTRKLLLDLYPPKSSGAGAP